MGMGSKVKKMRLWDSLVWGLGLGLGLVWVVNRQGCRFWCLGVHRWIPRIISTRDNGKDRG